MTHRWLLPLWGLLLLTIMCTACTPQPILAPGSSLTLLSLNENSVDVAMALVRNEEGVVFLTATFTPPPGNHMYSKDLPRAGVDGLGRPTLLELTANSKMTALGYLMESTPAIEELTEVATLPIYPAGPVTLSLAVALPPGSGWVDDEISLTFMACSDEGCKPPVVGKIVTVRVPGADVISNP